MAWARDQAGMYHPLPHQLRDSMLTSHLALPKVAQVTSAPCRLPLSPSLLIYTGAPTRAKAACPPWESQVWAHQGSQPPSPEPLQLPNRNQSFHMRSCQKQVFKPHQRGLGRQENSRKANTPSQQELVLIAQKGQGAQVTIPTTPAHQAPTFWESNPSSVAGGSWGPRGSWGFHSLFPGQ